MKDFKQKKHDLLEMLYGALSTYERENDETVVDTVVEKEEVIDTVYNDLNQQDQPKKPPIIPEISELDLARIGGYCTERANGDNIRYIYLHEALLYERLLANKEIVDSNIQHIAECSKHLDRIRKLETYLDTRDKQLIELKQAFAKLSNLLMQI